MRVNVVDGQVLNAEHRAHTQRLNSDCEPVPIIAIFFRILACQVPATMADTPAVRSAVSSRVISARNTAAVIHVKSRPNAVTVWKPRRVRRVAVHVLEGVGDVVGGGHQLNHTEGVWRRRGILSKFATFLKSSRKSTMPAMMLPTPSF